MPPMADPASLRRPMIRLNAGTSRGSAGAPTNVRFPSTPSRVEIGVDVVIGGNGVDDEVETAGVLFHFVGIPRNNDFIGAEAERVVLLVRRRGEDSDVSSERATKLHGHVPESSQPDHADLLAFADAPVAHRRVCGDPRAEERCSSSDVQIRRKSQDEMFIDDDAIGIAAIGDAAKVFVRRIESERHVWAELLEVTFAIWAGAVGVHHATNRDEIAWLVLGNGRTDFVTRPTISWPGTIG